MRIKTAALATIALAAAGTFASIAGPAQANPGLNVPVTCEFQSTWTKTACTVSGNTFPYNWTVAKINALPKTSPTRAALAEMCADNTFVSWPYAKYVVAGDTLWNIALRAYGDGQKYKTIMTLNTMSTTNIKVGQWLRVKAMPVECIALNPYTV